MKTVEGRFYVHASNAANFTGGKIKPGFNLQVQPINKNGCSKDNDSHVISIVCNHRILFTSYLHMTIQYKNVHITCSLHRAFCYRCASEELLLTFLLVCHWSHEDSIEYLHTQNEVVQSKESYSLLHMAFHKPPPFLKVGWNLIYCLMNMVRGHTLGFMRQQICQRRHGTGRRYF